MPPKKPARRKPAVPAPCRIETAAAPEPDKTVLVLCLSPVGGGEMAAVSIDFSDKRNDFAHFAGVVRQVKRRMSPPKATKPKKRTTDGDGPAVLRLTGERE